jgi:hypothetical protein
MDESNLVKAMKIYYYLLGKGEITFEDNKELYLDYADSEVRYMVEILAKESDVIIEKYNQVIYLIPKEENDVIGIKDIELQKVISSDARKIDFYLAQYIMIVLITVFFSGKGNYVKVRDFIRVAELEEIITHRLSYANSKKEIETLQEEGAINITRMYEQWNALQIDDKSKKKTKYGYIRSVCGFLQKHKLIYFDQIEEHIRPTNKFTHLMTYNFLDNSRMEIIEKIFS